MPPLSATDAIAPAWEHTRRLMLGARNPRIFFKLALIAMLAQVHGCGGGFNAPARAVHGHSLPPAFTAGLIALIAVAALGGVAVGLALVYLGSRLQFVLFHAVMRSESVIAPIWHRYGAATWRWIGLKLLLVLGFLVCLAPLLVPVVLVLVRTFGHNQSVADTHLAPALATILLLVAVLFVLILAFAVSWVLLRDFGLPSMALEATPLRETVRRVLALVRAEPGQVALYLLLRFVLAAAGAMAAYLAILVGGFIAAVPLGGLGFAMWGAFHGAAVTGHVLMIAGWVLLAIIFAALLAAAGIALFGYLFTFLQAYAVYFLAGRYPLLGQSINPLPVPPAPAPAWQPGYFPAPQPPPAI